MKYKTLGKSGLLVSELALGAMIFGETGSRGTDEDTARRMIHRYMDLGGNHIDTANVYADGRSEEIVGRAIADRRDRVVLATKTRFAMGEGPNDTGLSRLQIQNSVEASLRRLGTETIDLLYMHSWDPLTPIEESLRAFDDLVRAGKVRYIGVSNFKAWQLMKSLALSDAHEWARFIAAQYQYSLVVRDIEFEYTDLCQTEGVGLVPWGPLGGGFLSGKYARDRRPETTDGRLAVMGEETEEAWPRRAVERNWRILDAVEAVAAAHPGATHAQIALAWLLRQAAVDSVMMGVRTPEQLEDNLGAANLDLSEAEVDSLTAASAPEFIYPYRFLQTYSQR